MSRVKAQMLYKSLTTTRDINLRNSKNARHQRLILNLLVLRNS